MRKKLTAFLTALFLLLSGAAGPAAVEAEAGREVAEGQAGAGEEETGQQLLPGGLAGWARGLFTHGSVIRGLR